MPLDLSAGSECVGEVAIYILVVFEVAVAAACGGAGAVPQASLSGRQAARVTVGSYAKIILEFGEDYYLEKCWLF